MGRGPGAGGHSECHTASSSKQASGMRGGEGGCVLAGHEEKAAPSASADGLSPRLRALWGPRARTPRKCCYSGWPLQPEADLQTRGRAPPASPPSSEDRPGSRLPPRPPPGLSVPRRHSRHPAAPTAPVTPRESQVCVDVWALTAPTPLYTLSLRGRRLVLSQPHPRPGRARARGRQGCCRLFHG